jgi:uncharacterized YceG family protein
MSPLFGGGRDRDAGGPRSAQERERARLEREQRRAAREGRPVDERLVVPEPEPATPEPVAPEPVAPEPVPEREPVVFEPEPAALEPEREPEPPTPALEPEPWQPEPAPEPEPREPEPEPEPEPPAPEPPAPAIAPQPPARPEPVAAHDGEWWTPDAEPQPEPEPDPAPPADEPIGVKRIQGAPSVRDLPDIAGPRTGRGPKVPPKRGTPRPRRGLRRVLFLLPLLILLAIVWFLIQLFQPFAGEADGEAVRVTVPRGSGAGEVGNLLVAKDIVSSSFFFGLRSRITGDRDKLKAGTFTLRKGMSYAAALDALTATPAPPPVIRVTLPEGLSIKEAARALRDSGIEGDYPAAVRRSRRLTARQVGAPKGTTTKEGLLFPATYELRRGQATAGRLVNQQLDAFDRAIDQVDQRAARRAKLTPYDVVTIASMVEREATLARERPIIAAVIYNRLRRGIPLGIDATIRYSLDNWTRPLRVSELERDTPYNTRKRTGLPPTPIGSPGLASLKAAAAPAKSKALFYVVKPCGNGAHAFSTTDAEFQRDVAAYNKARDARGGRDPSRC